MTKIASISPTEFWMGRTSEYPPNLSVRSNANTLIMRVNSLLSVLKYPSPIFVTSGYRPGRFNKAAGGALKSAHLTGEAIDLGDPDGRLAAAILSHPLGPETFLRNMGLWMENPKNTKGWVHLDLRERNTRIFNP